VNTSLLQLLKNKRAATAIEYSLIVAGVAVAISIVVFTVGTDLSGLFSDIGGMLVRAITVMG
jgi:Flp pilus assembly pilin Flp